MTLSLATFGTEEHGPLLISFGFEFEVPGGRERGKL